MLVQIPIGKCDQPIVYAFQLLNNGERTIEKEALMTVYALRKYHHYLLSNKFVFYVDHMALLYLVKKPQVYVRIIQWLLMFLEYNFWVVYKPEKSHLVTDAFFRLSTSKKPSGMLDQITDAPLFLLQLV